MEHIDPEYLRKISIGVMGPSIVETAISEFAALPLWDPNDNGQNQPSKNCVKVLWDFQ